MDPCSLAGALLLDQRRVLTGAGEGAGVPAQGSKRCWGRLGGKWRAALWLSRRWMDPSPLVALLVGALGCWTLVVGQSASGGVGVGVGVEVGEVGKPNQTTNTVNTTTTTRIIPNQRDHNLRLRPRPD